MISPLSCRMRIALSCCLLLVSAVCVEMEARAQDNRLPFVAAPPPMKFVPRSERAQLSGERDAKARTREAIELAETRLLHAEALTATQQYDAASDELGIFQGLIEDALHFLNENKAGNKKIRDVYRHFDLTLRTYGTRIESIRRATPIEYKVNINAIADFTCTVRIEALNAFFGDEMMHESGCAKSSLPVKENIIKETPEAASTEPTKKQ
jgi:hypothetical protein